MQIKLNPEEEIEQDSITEAENNKLIVHQKQNKAEGPHSIVNELIKYVYY